MFVPRYLEQNIVDDLTEKMVFLAGPRQVGKTTLARHLLDQWHAGIYLNWDNRNDRKMIRDAVWPGDPESLIVLDEIHKWRNWKSWLKGEYDKHQERVRFLVTGSARLEIYRRGGDSLQGRYHHYRLHPFTLSEIEGTIRDRPEPFREIELPADPGKETMEALMTYGGFPEPFLSASDRTLRRWQKERVDRFLREDIRDLGTVRDLASLQVLADIVPERVGSPLSINSLREDLDVSHKSVSKWLEILARLYYIHRIQPFTTKKIRSLKLMSKIYLWDWSMVEERAARFENLVAMHLLKFCHLLEDHDGFRAELYYLRERSGKEVDFLVTVKRKPWFCVEVKLSAAHFEPTLSYFRERLNIPWAYQVTLEGEKDVMRDGVRIVPARRFLAALV